ncbi:hypothetical protein U8326_02235 [Tsuneonella sp. CC-YZS046]|uniref:hypothetical protein n=1 Tax=Tsuneonella sp. CC-YZS046 TaxID=3042152 RepID=UPI002D79813F|nr:hypothetical protein [Tsuneonella sp. CC-YZS046]WRO67012.1 hypothetical protein U8326_02235 [Tsuneonella sp. CC-YZS046]
MTEDKLALMRRIGASLKTIGAACAESFNHACAGSTTPLQPLDERLGQEVRNLRRDGQGQLADALLAFRDEMGANDNG